MSEVLPGLTTNFTPAARKVSQVDGITKLVRLVIPQSGILIPRRMAVISFLGGLFPRALNYVPKKIHGRLKVIHPKKKHSTFEVTADGIKAATHSGRQLEE
jgi:hypothetical protein